MHRSLQHSANGKALSEFINNACVARLVEAHETSILKVMQLSKILMTAINMEGGLARTGFVDDRRELPKFMVIADLMGKRVALWSNAATIIRELCGSFYGSGATHFGQGSLLRHDIDAAAAAAEVSSTTLCLVLVSPWGEALGDRFWRLMTIQKTESGAYRDSDSVLTSMQSPPLRAGMSVLGERMEQCVHARVVEAFCNEWRALNCDGGCVVGGVGAPSKPTDARETVVLRGVVASLRAENDRLKQSLDSLKTSKEAEVRARVDEKLDCERAIFYADIESLNGSLEVHSNQTTIERVACDALRTSLEAADAEIERLGTQIRTLRGEVLVAQETSSHTKKHRNEELEKLREALKTARAEVKRIEAARKQEVDQKMAERADAHALALQLESQRAEVERLAAELQNSNSRESTFRDTASEQAGRLLDLNQANTDKLKACERKIRNVKTFGPHILKQLAAQLVRTLAAQRTAHRFAVTLRRRAERAKAERSAGSECSQASTIDVCETVATGECGDAPPSPPLEHSDAPNVFPADAIASANACISMLHRFVDRAVTPVPPPQSNNTHPHHPHFQTFQPYQQAPTQTFGYYTPSPTSPEYAYNYTTPPPPRWYGPPQRMFKGRGGHGHHH